MDIFDIRRSNLQWLIDRHYSSRRSRLAKALGRRNSEIWRLFVQNPAHKRNIGEELAREIESHLNYTQGWLDQRHLFEGEGTNPAAPGKANDKTLVLLNPQGHKFVAILNYERAAQWTDGKVPYPMTADTEGVWIRDADFSPMTVGIRIEGQSMREAFYPGDLVFIDREVKPETGDYVGALLRKRRLFVFAKLGSINDITLRKEVPALLPEDPQYKVLPITRSNPIRIAGTMVMHQRLRRRPRSQGEGS